jgi:surface polysaccharide O-acyltransferase-like enzyme
MEDFQILGFIITEQVQLASLFIGLVVFVGNCKLFAKADLPYWTAFVPFLNIITAMKLVGRPVWHAWLFFTPAVIYLLPKTMIEVAQSFGKRKTSDYVLVLVFNVFYILNLGLSYDEVYEGPAYQKNEKKVQSNNLNMA